MNGSVSIGPAQKAVGQLITTTCDIPILSDVPKLNPTEQCRTLAVLSRCESAGIPPMQACDLLLADGPQLADVGRRLAARLRRGDDYADAALAAGIIDHWQARLVKVAGNSGVRARVLKSLSEDVEARLSRHRAIRTQMVYPAILLVAAVFIQPFPGLVLGHISGWGYLLQTFGTLLKISIAILLCVRLGQSVLAGQIHDSSHARQLGFWLTKTWRLGPLHARRMRRDYLQALALQLHAGVAILTAVPQARQQVKNAYLRERWRAIDQQLSRGESLANAVAETADFSHALEVIRAAEPAGKLDDALLRFCTSESQDLAREDKSTAQWLPRIAYALIVIFIVGGFEFTAPATPG